MEALSGISNAASNYLGQARNIYGGGAGYAEAFGAVLAVLDKLSEAPVDELTASAQRLITREQTEVLVDELAQLRAQVALLMTEFRQVSMRPPGTV